MKLTQKIFSRVILSQFKGTFDIFSTDFFTNISHFVATDVYALFKNFVGKSTTWSCKTRGGGSTAVYTMRKKTSNLVENGFSKVRAETPLLSFTDCQVGVGIHWIQPKCEDEDELWALADCRRRWPNLANMIHLRHWYVPGPCIGPCIGTWCNEHWLWIPICTARDIRPKADCNHCLRIVCESKRCP